MEFWLCPNCGSANSKRGDKCYGCGVRRTGAQGQPASHRPYMLFIGMAVVLAFVAVGGLTMLGRMQLGSPPAVADASPTDRPTPTPPPTASPSPTTQATPTTGASESPSPTPTKSHGPTQVATNVKVMKSTNWGGYGLEGNAYTDISAEWDEPQVDCTPGKAGHVSFWVGLDGVTSDTVEQVGTAASCTSGNNGAAEHYAWIEMYPDIMREVAIDISPGDHLNAVVHAVGTNLYQVILHNTTSGASYQTSVVRNGAYPNSAEWILEATTVCDPSCGIAALPKFADVTFANLGVESPDGAVDLGTAKDLVQFDLRSLTKGQMAHLSPLRLGDDPGFDVSWLPAR